jgi:hypothetical protein
VTLYDNKGRAQQALPENAAQESDGNLDKIAEATRITQAELLRLILVEMRVQTFILATEFGVSEADLAELRSDPDLLEK